MSPDRDDGLWSEAWRTAEELLDHSAERLEEALRALKAERPDLAEAVESLTRAPTETNPDLGLHGELIGNYQLLSRLGRGGMGEVWEARHVELDRSAAVKVLAEPFPDDASVDRFKYEAHLQASLSHPGIAALYETGSCTLRGLRLPWIAMELVPGARSISEHVASLRFSTRAIVELFATFCEAVGHAHEQGVLHRDIKPSNLLVDAKGRPVVIDFGIARASIEAEDTPRTRTGIFLGTPKYAAPERLDPRQGRSGARADVYSLGLILHELLAGVPRFEEPGLPEDLIERSRLRLAGRRICRSGPLLPVEWIVAKATSFDAARRYVSATDLAEDLRRYLSQRVPHATPESSAYRLRLFLKRNRVITGVASVVLVTLLLGGWGTSLGLMREARAMEVARDREADMAEAYTFLADFLWHLQPGRGLNGQPPIAPEMGNLLAHAYEVARAEHGELSWRVESALGDLFYAFGASELAQERFAAALADAQVELEPEAKEILRLHRLISHTLLDERDFVGAKQHLDVALRGYEQLEDAHSVAQTLFDLGALYHLRADLPEAELRIDYALTWLRDHPSLDPAEFQTARSNSARLYREIGKHDREREILEQLLAQYRKSGKPATPSIIEAMADLGTAMQRTGSGPDALRLAQEAIDLAARTLPSTSYVLLNARKAKAGILVDQGRISEGIREHEEVLESQRHFMGEEHESVRTTRYNIATSLVLDGQFERAVREFEDAAVEGLAAQTDQDLGSLTSLGMYAQALQAVERFDDALAAAELAVEGLHGLKGVGAAHPNAIMIKSLRGSIWQDLGQLAKAEEDFREALETMEAEHPADKANLLTLRINLACLLTAEGEYDEAEALHRASIVQLEETGALDSIEGILARQNLAHTLWKRASHDEAEEILKDVFDTWPEEVSKDNARVQPVFLNMARVCAALQRVDEARSWVEVLLRQVPEDSELARRGRELLSTL